MFDIGFWEMAFIGVIALVVVGPERLPGVARSVGLWMGKGRRMLNEVKSDVKREMKEYDVEQVRALKNELESASKDLKDITSSNSDPLGIKDVSDELKGAVDSTAVTTDKVETKTVQAGKQTRKKVTKKKNAATARPVTKKATRKKSTKPTAVIAKKRATRKPSTSKSATKKSSAGKLSSSKPSTRKSAPVAKTAKTTGVEKG